ncbi:hypothetical protein BH11MYX3_BH11MYX3_00260 [soil metagenome]
MFWMITALAAMGAAGVSLCATMSRLGGDVEKAFRQGPALAEAAFAEGAYGRIVGVASASGTLPTVPGLDLPCLIYERVVYEVASDRQSAGGWKIAQREIVGGDVDVTVGDTVVRFDARDLYIYTAPSHDGHEGMRTTRVRYVPPGATVQVLGTLTREVDDDPNASRDYRSVATRYRLIGKRKQPIVLAVA